MKNILKTKRQNSATKVKDRVPAESTKLKKTPFLFTGVPLVYLVIPMLLTWLFVYLKFFYYKELNASDVASVINSTYSDASCADNTKLYRTNQYRYTFPLMLSEEVSESPRLLDLKQKITENISGILADPEIQGVSAYVCLLNDDKWFCINPEEEFVPASLIKVPLMMAFLKDADSLPGLLEKKLFFEQPRVVLPKQSYAIDQVQPGSHYTIRELISKMIMYSDNNATYLLQKNVTVKSFKDIFSVIDLPMGDYIDANFRMKIRSYSKLFELLYDGNYLSHANSEYALKLLSKTVFNKGITRNLPSDIEVAHKFGETIEADGNNIPAQLHETSIIYLQGNPMLVAVFTKGRNKEKMCDAISSISDQVVGYFSKPLL